MTTDPMDLELERALAQGSDPTPVVFIMGAGAVGTALAAKLTRAGVPVAGLHGRQSHLSESASAVSGVLGSSGELPAIISASDVVIISVRDARIAEVAKRLLDEKRLRPHQVVLHTAGNRSAAEMLGAVRGAVKGIGTLHPLIAVTDAPGTQENLTGATFGVEGDEAAVAKARKLVKLLGGRALLLAPDQMALYHAAAVIASNYLVALADVAQTLLVKAGIAPDEALPALLPLMTSAVRNLGEVGLPAALTGPVVRGDVASVEGHVTALKRSAPETLDLYRRLGQEVLRIARQRQPDLDGNAAGQLAQIFGKPRG